MIIAVSGKGGVGKSTLASLIVRSMVEYKEKPVLAVDADPNSTLAEKLGLKADLAIGDIREDAIHQKYDAPAGVPKQRAVECQLEQIVVEGNGFDLVVMGRGEGPGCYCSLNNMLRTFLKELTSRYSHIVMDNEAGLEHLSRLTTEKIDLMLVVSDPSPTSLQAAERIGKLCVELSVIRGKIGLLVNRDDGSFTKEQALAATGLNLFGLIPEDPIVKDFEYSQKPLVDIPQESAALQAINKVLQDLRVIR
ncbi:MAG: ATP-binding protein [Armatimonadota bacterium]